jgi:hypothetical protein
MSSITLGAGSPADASGANALHIKPAANALTRKEWIIFILKVGAGEQTKQQGGPAKDAVLAVANGGTA